MIIRRNANGKGIDYIFETTEAEDQLSELAAYFDDRYAMAQDQQETATHALSMGRRPKGEYLEMSLKALATMRAYEDAGRMVRTLVKAREKLANELEIRNAAEALGWEFDDDQA